MSNSELINCYVDRWFQVVLTGIKDCGGCIMWCFRDVDTDWGVTYECETPSSLGDPLLTTIEEQRNFPDPLPDQTIIDCLNHTHKFSLKYVNGRETKMAYQRVFNLGEFNDEYEANLPKHLKQKLSIVKKEEKGTADSSSPTDCQTADRRAPDPSALQNRQGEES